MLQKNNKFAILKDVLQKTKEKIKNKIAVNYLRLNKNIGPEKLPLVKTHRPSQHTFLIRKTINMKN